MYYVFLLRVIKLLACLHACLLWLTHSSSTCRVAQKASTVIASRRSSVTHCTSPGCLSGCIRLQKFCLVFWNTPLLPSHEHQYLWIVTFQNSLIGIESSITSPPLFTQVASAPPFPINWWTQDGECLSESSGLTLQGLFRHMHASFVLLVLWLFMEPAGLADLYSCHHLRISRPLSQFFLNA